MRWDVDIFFFSFGLFFNENAKAQDLQELLTNTKADQVKAKTDKQLGEMMVRGAYIMVNNHRSFFRMGIKAPPHTWVRVGPAYQDRVVLERTPKY